MKCHYLLKVYLELSFQTTYYMLVTETVPVNQYLRILYTFLYDN